MQKFGDHQGLLIACLILFCHIVAHPVQAGGWQGTPPLKNKFKEHEFLAACREGNLPAVQYYLQHGGVEVNGYFLSGNTSGLALTGLYVAALEGYRSVTQYLLENGADPHVRISTGWTPLLAACEYGYTEIVQILLDARADPNQDKGQDLGQGPKPDDGTPPLSMAAEYGHTEIVQMLLDNGAGVDCRARDGSSALYFAAQNGHGTIVNLLVDANADPTATWPYAGIFAKSPRDAAWCSCPIFRWLNPKKYDTYAPILMTLEQAEQNWRRTGGNVAPLANIGDLGGQPSAPTVTEPTLRLRAIEPPPVSHK